MKVAAKKLRQFRQQAKVTLEQVGKACKPPITKQAVALWEKESGGTNPSKDQLDIFCDLVKVPLEMLVEDSIEITAGWKVTTENHNENKDLLEWLDVFTRLNEADRALLLNTARRLNQK